LLKSSPPEEPEVPNNRMSGVVLATGRQRAKLKYLILRYLNIYSQKSLASVGRSDSQLRQQIFYVDQVVVKDLLGDIQQLEDFRVGN
jgi:UDP-glucose 4-epimerase